MAAEITCPRALTQEHSERVVVEFPKSLRTRCGEFWTRYAAFRQALLVAIYVLALVTFFTGAWLWVPLWVLSSCHKAPGIALTNFTMRDMALVQSVASTPDSPWRVNSAFDATFSTWNPNTVTKCFTTYRRMDVRVEYKGRVILEQQFPLGFSLEPRRRHPFSIGMKSNHGQLTKDWGEYMQAELRSGKISLNFFYSTRYLRADRRSRWRHNGCIVVVRSRLGTVLTQDCYVVD